MTDASTKVEDYLTSAIAGSLVSQIAARRHISFGTLIGPNRDGESPELRALSDELTELGIDPSLIANHSLLALVALFAQEHNADLIVSQYTSLLWTILGDPKSGSPPEIYRRAGCAMHLALLGILDPSFVDNATQP
jgi:hypothetical protein